MLQQKATVPIVIVAVVAVVALVAWFAKANLSGPQAGHAPPPTWIDPATGKPRANTGGNSSGNMGAAGGNTGMMMRRGGPGGMGSPGMAQPPGAGGGQ